LGSTNPGDIKENNKNSNYIDPSLEIANRFSESHNNVKINY
jgi:hypothetical protein